MRTYDIDPVLLCKCGAFDSERHMVEVLGGRYVEAADAEAEIARLREKLEESQLTVDTFKKGCRDLIDRLRTGEL